MFSPSGVERNENFVLSFFTGVFNKLFGKNKTEVYGNIDIVKLTEYINALSKEEENSKKTESSEKTVTKKKAAEPDFVAMLIREKEYALSLCDRLEAKYGKAEFGNVRRRCRGSHGIFPDKEQYRIPVSVADLSEMPSSEGYGGLRICNFRT